MPLQLSLKGFIADLSDDALLNVHLIETYILRFQLFEALHHQSIHTAELRKPLQDSGAVNVVFASNFRD